VLRAEFLIVVAHHEQFLPCISSDKHSNRYCCVRPSVHDRLCPTCATMSCRLQHHSS